MLAVKLHKSRRPWLGRGSHLVPVVKWPAARLQIKAWVNVLTLDTAVSFPNNRIAFITLVRIPDHLRVAVQHDWTEKRFGMLSGKLATRDSSGRAVFTRLADVPTWWKRALGEWTERVVYAPEVIQEHEPGFGLPELILGEALPDKWVRWTKDWRLLMTGDRRARGAARLRPGHED